MKTGADEEPTLVPHPHLFSGKRGRPAQSIFEVYEREKKDSGKIGGHASPSLWLHGDKKALSNTTYVVVLVVTS